MTSKPSTTRPSSTTAIPIVKPTCKIHPTVIVADKAHLTGPNTISIAANTIIHPHARIKAEYSDVVIGDGCIINEKAIVGLSSASSSNEDEDADVVIGSGVSVESGAVVEARKVGDYCTLGINCRIGRGAVLGKWCRVGALCEVKPMEVVEDYTVIYGDGKGERRVDVSVRDRREVSEARWRGMEMERELLRGIVVDSKMKWVSP